METKKIILKSTHPEEYPDLTLECKVIPNAEIGEYIKSIPEERKFTAYKSKPVEARPGKVGEKVTSTLKTIINGREYILSEETSSVKERMYTEKEIREDGSIEEKTSMKPDMVITNVCSTSNEQYVTKYQKFIETYYPLTEEEQLSYSHISRRALFMPLCDLREFAQVSEPVIIITAWGSEAVCLPGSYIVTYSAEQSDYNTVEKGAFESTYTIESTTAKKLTR